MKQFYCLFLFSLVLLAGCGCEQPSLQITDLLGSVDSTPPTLLGTDATGTTYACITFDEPLDANSVELSCIDHQITAISISKEVLTISFSRALPLGKAIPIEGRVEDIRGNSLQFSVNLWAKNMHLPTLLINEFSTKGSENNPDRVELVALSRGNLAGMTIYAGTEGTAEDWFTFGDVWIERGSYVVVVFGEGIVGEQEHPSFHRSGLGSNNGCLTLAQTPLWNAPILDAVLWGNAAATTYEGFGSQQLLLDGERLFREGQWDSKLSNDSIPSVSSTATRTFCRDCKKDSNSKEDWYICDTRQASFGGENSLVHYTP